MSSIKDQIKINKMIAVVKGLGWSVESKFTEGDHIALTIVTPTEEFEPLNKE